MAPTKCYGKKRRENDYHYHYDEELQIIIVIDDNDDYNGDREDNNNDDNKYCCILFAPDGVFSFATSNNDTQLTCLFLSEEDYCFCSFSDTVKLEE